MREYDRTSGCGCITAQAYDEDIPVFRESLPPQVQRADFDLVGCELTFEVGEGSDGTLQASAVHLLLEPAGGAGWQLRKVA